MANAHQVDMPTGDVPSELSAMQVGSLVVDPLYWGTKHQRGQRISPK